MKNNKGYTLVELLVSVALLAIIMVEIFGVMQNSSKLYSNGTYEVELQTEAQQVIQQMNELMIDADHTISANYNALTNSDDITISFNGVAIYNIILSKSDPKYPYGVLYYTKQDLVDGSTTTPAPIPMAEYVHSISLNMADYDQNDFVTLSVSMNNGKYSYVANQTIYLRNEIGSGNSGSALLTAATDYELDVLRYREYDLDELLKEDYPGEVFDYEWDPASASSGAGTIYKIDGDRNHVIKTDATYANSVRTALGPYTLLATSADHDHQVRIKISSKAVMFGAQCGTSSYGKGILFANTYSSYDYISAIPIQGVAVEAATITVEFVHRTEASDDTQITTTTIAAGSPQSVYVKYEVVADTYAEMELQSVSYGYNQNLNTLDITSSRFMYENGTGGRGYDEYLDSTGKPLYCRVTLHYDQIDVKGYVLIYPYALHDPDMSSTAETQFEAAWNAVDSTW